MNFALEMMNFALKLMNFALKINRRARITWWLDSGLAGI